MLFKGILIFFSSLSFILSQDEYIYEENGNILQIIDYLSRIKMIKDIDVLYIPLKDQNYWSQDFMKSKEENFFTIYNHNKSQGFLLKDVTQDHTNYTTKLANPYTTTGNNINIMSFRSLEEISFFQEIELLFNKFPIFWTEYVNFHGTQEITLFQIEVFQ